MTSSTSHSHQRGPVCEVGASAAGVGDWLSVAVGVEVTDVLADGVEGSAVDASTAEGVGADFDTCAGVVGTGGTDVTGVARLVSGVGVRLGVASGVGVGVSSLDADGSRVGVGVPDLEGSAVGTATLGSTDLEGSAVGMVTLGSTDRVGVGSPGPSPPVPHPARPQMRSGPLSRRVA